MTPFKVLDFQESTYTELCADIFSDANQYNIYIYIYILYIFSDANHYSIYIYIIYKLLNYNNHSKRQKYVYGLCSVYVSL
jgi:hypothetical protein